MTDTFYPDISSYEAGLSVAGASAVCVKVTEGASYENPDYGRAVSNAAANGVWLFAYHFLHAGNVAGQAAWCYSKAGKTPIMVDFEPTAGSSPTVEDAAGFIDAYRALGGECNIIYLPHWYWQQLGSPSLAPLSSRGMHLVASDYTSYSDSGPGWGAYGGMVPVIWQYTDEQPFNGARVDWNAFKGTVEQLAALAGATAPPPSPQKPPAERNTLTPIVADGVFGVKTCAAQQFVDFNGDLAECDGDFGPYSKRAMQQHLGVKVDGIIGPVTVEALQRRVGATHDGVWGRLTTDALQVSLNKGTY